MRDGPTSWQTSVVAFHCRSAITVKTVATELRLLNAVGDIWMPG